MIFEDFDMDGTVTVTATPSTPSPAMLRARRAEADHDFPCLIWARFRWKGTANDYTTSFVNYGQLLDFEKRNPRLELQDWGAEKALYLFPPVVTFHTAEEVRERELWQAVLHAKRGEEFHATMRAYNEAKRPSWRQETRDKHN